ncbi:MAG: hypothetical protein HY735_32195 [Verrucomicrobia bacterium]|nr:hypothetical protein [Verrucomicrobiota bacterium]
MINHCRRHVWPVMLLGSLASTSLAQDRVFSGPQPGEKITPFKVVEVRGPTAGKERDLVAENNGAPTALVFVHGIERSMAPLMTVIDQYGAARKDLLRTAFIFLTADRVASEKRLPAVGQSLRLQSLMALSPDGLEGPGNYGLNKNCLMTIVVAKDNKVVANFALVQPGIADAPQVIGALADACGDSHPPTVEELRARQQALAGTAPARMAAREEPTMMRPGGGASDLTSLDLESEKGLREAVKALIAEVRALRQELNALRANPREPTPEKREIPGAAPTDEKLLSMLRSFIQKTNDDATVDAVLRRVEYYVKENPELRKQAIDGWKRVIYLKYGTDYALKAGQEMVERLEK